MFGLGRSRADDVSFESDNAGQFEPSGHVMCTEHEQKRLHMHYECTLACSGCLRMTGNLFGLACYNITLQVAHKTGTYFHIVFTAG